MILKLGTYMTNVKNWIIINTLMGSILLMILVGKVLRYKHFKLLYCVYLLYFSLMTQHLNTFYVNIPSYICYTGVHWEF